MTDTEKRLESSTPNRYIQIDEEGYFKMDDLRVADAESGRAWLASLVIDSRGRARARIGGDDVLVEAFDEPYLALDISKNGDAWTVTMPYGHSESFDATTLSLDEWDRFHGRTSRGIPFVLSRSAQARFFDLVDSYDDDAITIAGEEFKTPPWLRENLDAEKGDWWSELYRTGETRWNLGQPTVALTNYLPRLKLQRSRILVPGCGEGHDAAWLAQQGHIVTALDFSDEALSRAKKLYGHIPDLTFLKADILRLPVSMDVSFDIVFEHTLYCAIPPHSRGDLARTWRRVLVDGGHLLGVFYVFDKPMGPPFGTTEWEIRQRLNKTFRPLFWNRMHDSIEERRGRELFIYAEKRRSL